MKLKQYSKYKSSGSDFFENIPVEWNISKLKFLISSLESGKRENIDLLTDDDNTVFSLGGEHINWNGTLNLKNKRFVSENYYNSMNNGKIAENDILLVKDGATIGKTAFVKNKPYSKMAVNEHVFIIRSNNKIESKLLYYLISSDIGFTQIKLTETGSAQGGINSEFISQVNFPLNYDKEEQTKIVNFLDKKIEDINSLIVKNKKLIQLLEEKRTSLINHVVTCGLNPNVKMKDSGIEWIGEIPENWEIRKLKSILNSKAQYGANEEPEDDETKHNYRYVRITDINDLGELRTDSLAFLSEKSSKGFILGEGDVLFARSGATVGKTYIYSKNDGDCSFAGYLIRYKSNENILLPKLLFYFSQSESYWQWISLASTQSTIENVSADKYNEMPLPIPQSDIQNNMITFLDKKNNLFLHLSKKIGDNINLLEEYKKSLIYNVVTGKIKI
ncbi:MAG: hypothetical protein ISP01_02465 [Methanobrevibacter arboriphilus]|uniref:Uncharacterized protein n=1 Tax=Methanobrevibacter arboriphilus TaxID=39441 RepID=A0A843AA85_METAZ|nr:hypothetical protein [Methanobrevibacter arboriphilus]MBF4468247.1 hypothetical protein [Methanobrevibacter arboriphilus]